MLRALLPSFPPPYISSECGDNNVIEICSIFIHTPRRIWMKTSFTCLRTPWFWFLTGLGKFLKKWLSPSKRMLWLLFSTKTSLYFHSWASKHLSRSYPSSEVRNNTVKWYAWINRLSPKYAAHSERAGIYDAILLSKQSVSRKENLLAAAICFWNFAVKTFDFRVALMALTLLGMAQIFGFRPHGRPADTLGDYHKRKNGEGVAEKFSISSAVNNQNCSFSNFLIKFSTEKDNDQQHMFFFLHRLNMFIFPNRSSVVLLKYKHLTEYLHNHMDVSLGPTVLAHPYKNLISTIPDSPLNIAALGAFWMIQIWLQVYFPELRFPDIVQPKDQVMTLSLMSAEVPKR